MSMKWAHSRRVWLGVVGGGVLAASESRNWAARAAHAANLDGASPPRLPRRDPSEVGLDAKRLAEIDDLANAGIAEGKYPGCVVCVGRRGAIAWLKAYGRRQVEPTESPMTVETVFDLASLTKPIATATSIMQLTERGRLSLDQQVMEWLPEFGVGGKEAITIQDLLVHQSGLIADNPIGDYQRGAAEAYRRIDALAPVAPLRSKFIYSDVNFIVLGRIVRAATGLSLDEFTQREIFRPLGMRETGFLPAESLRERAAPTEKLGDRWLRGEVHDPRAAQLGGVAGHAGLFSTAEDLAVYSQMLLGRGAYADARVLKAETVERMSASYPVSSGVRGLGWDKKTGFSTNRGVGMSDAAYGHGGFTGTALWIDPQLDLFFLFLSNRLHPRGRQNINPHIGRIGGVAVASIL